VEEPPLFVPMSARLSRAIRRRQSLLKPHHAERAEALQNPALRVSDRISVLAARVSPIIRRTPAAVARHRVWPAQLSQPIALPRVRHTDTETSADDGPPRTWRGLGNHGLAAVHKYLGKRGWLSGSGARTNDLPVQRTLAAPNVVICSHETLAKYASRTSLRSANSRRRIRLNHRP
jgi:hypothetical protein